MLESGAKLLDAVLNALTTVLHILVLVGGVYHDVRLAVQLGVDPLARHIGNHGTDIVLAGVHAYVIHIGDDAALDNDGAGFLCGTQGVIAGIVRNHGQNDIAAGGHHILNVGNSSARVILKADGGVVPAILGGDLFQAVINADKELWSCSVGARKPNLMLSLVTEVPAAAAADSTTDSAAEDAELAVEDAVEDAVDAEPPQAAKESAIADAVISASAFFIVISPSCFSGCIAFRCHYNSRNQPCQQGRNLRIQGESFRVFLLLRQFFLILVQNCKQNHQSFYNNQTLVNFQRHKCLTQHHHSGSGNHQAGRAVFVLPVHTPGKSGSGYALIKIFRIAGCCCRIRR